MLAAAFQRAKEGRLCTVCQKRVAHAIFQRHREACTLNPDDNDVVFLSANHIPANEFFMSEMKQPKIQVPSQASTQIPSTQQPSTSKSQGDGQRYSYNRGVVKVVKKIKREPKRRSVETTPKIVEYFVSDTDSNFSHSCSSSRRHSIDSEFSSFSQSGRKKLKLVQKPLTDFESVGRLKSNLARLQNVPIGKLRGDLIARIRNLIDEYGWKSYANSQSSQHTHFTQYSTTQNSQDGDISAGSQLFEASGNLENFDPEIDAQSRDLCSQASLFEEENSNTQMFATQDPKNQTPDKIHYSLQIFWEIALRVIEQTTEQFWKENLRYFLALFQCSVKSQQLFIRLLGQRRDWFSVKKFKFPAAGDNLKFNFKELYENDLLDSSVSSRTQITLFESLSVQGLPELTALAKKFKLSYDRKKRKVLIEDLVRIGAQKTVYGKNVELAMLQTIQKASGIFYRLPMDIWNLFYSLFTLYSPISMDSSKLIDEPHTPLMNQLMYKLLLLKTSKAYFPGPRTPQILIEVYPEFEHLKSYTHAKSLEKEIILLIERQDYEKAYDLGLKIKQELFEHLEKEENIQYYRNIKPFLRKYTPAWVLSRCVSLHFADLIQKQKRYQEAVDLLKLLINNETVAQFCPFAMGKWYDRLALLMDFHLKRRNEALEVCLAGLEKDGLSQPIKLSLQTRIEKMFPSKNSFSHSKLLDFDEIPVIWISGNIFPKSLGDGRLNHFIRTSSQGETESCTVEEIALGHFKKEMGYIEGVHGEGDPWHSLFGLLCGDIIFDHNIPFVWLSEIQEYPCDLNFKDFYENRKEQFEKRFDEISKVDFEVLETKIRQNYEHFFNFTNSEISWKCFCDFDQIIRLAECCSRRLLLMVFRRLATDYKNSRSGFPDLTIWNHEKKKLISLKELKLKEHTECQQFIIILLKEHINAQ